MGGVPFAAGFAMVAARWQRCPRVSNETFLVRQRKRVDWGKHVFNTLLDDHTCDTHFSIL